MKYCPNCGAQCEDHASFCGNCGASLQGGAEAAGEESFVVNPGIGSRNIALCVIFTIITCGIYGIYWMYKLNQEINQLSGEVGATSGVMVILFDIITCGIYSWYWSYKMGERCDRMKGDRNGYSHVLFLVLSLFGFSIVNYALMQDAINKVVGE